MNSSRFLTYSPCMSPDPILPPFEDMLSSSGSLSASYGITPKHSSPVLSRISSMPFPSMDASPRNLLIR